MINNSSSEKLQSQQICVEVVDSSVEWGTLSKSCSNSSLKVQNYNSYLFDWLAQKIRSLIKDLTG